MTPTTRRCGVAFEFDHFPADDDLHHQTLAVLVSDGATALVGLPDELVGLLRLRLSHEAVRSVPIG
jgi:hypothetical protein